MSLLDMPILRIDEALNEVVLSVALNAPVKKGPKARESKKR